MELMSQVWDRTVAVAERRAPALVAVSLLLVWLPGLIQRGVQLALAGPTPGAAMAAGPAATVGVIGIVTTVLALFGAVTVVALASEPTLATPSALRLALRRLPAIIGLSLLLLLALALLTVPIVLAVPGLAAMGTATSADLSAGASAFVRWYSLALTVFLVWAQARLMLVSPVVVNERQGVRSVARSVRLTAGLTWRLIGVLLLFLLVAGVSVIAARSVTGVVAVLLLGDDRPATVQFLAVAAASLVAVGWGTIAAVFGAQLYLVRVDGAPVPLAAGRAVPAGEPARPQPARTGPWG